ncbi:MAG: radical SAM protein [Desulfobacteraceae bacterium]|nr:radical SAM protein [Desulfobacteraceae bacterium]
MRTIAFGYSTRCNLRCGHCVAKGEIPETSTMDLGRAREIIHEMAEAGVKGISFTAGEPLIFFNEINELVRLCRDLGIYTRIVTNSFWAATREKADQVVTALQKSGLCQLRLSYSRWHQEGVAPRNVVNAATSCQKQGVDYFVSFVTDFSEQDDPHEAFLRANNLRFFPEPLIYSGRAAGFDHGGIRTDFQANRCPMNPLLTPELDMYACCDAGSHFTDTNVFFLGNLAESHVDELFKASETNRLFHLIRTAGITPLAQFAGFTSRQIIRYRKCDLCKEMLNDPATLARLRQAADGHVNHWTR